MELAVERYVSMGRHAIAGKHCMTIAEMYETSIMDNEKAIEYYKNVSFFFSELFAQKYLLIF